MKHFVYRPRKLTRIAVKKTTKLKKERKIFSPLQLPIETFLFFPKLNKAEQRGDFTAFFEELTEKDLHARLDDREIFLKKQNAVQYGRFAQRDVVLVRAFLPHTAILGNTHGLSLKKGVITKQHIHGCYPQLTQNSIYLENPFFDVKNYPPFMHRHEELNPG